MIVPSKDSAKAEDRWTLIVERFRAACILYKEGSKIESRRIIKEELPDLIRAWSRSFPAALMEEAKADLREMFTREQSIVDQGLKLQCIYKETLTKSIIPQVEEQVAAKYRTLYLQEQRERKERRKNDSLPQWEGPTFRSRPHSFGQLNKRIPIDNVREMIDSVREMENESENLTDSVPTLNEIVSTLKQSNATPRLSEGNAISI